VSAIAEDIPRPIHWGGLIPWSVILGIVMAMGFFVSKTKGDGGSEGTLGCSNPTISAGASAGTVQTAVNNAANQAVLCFADGNYSFQNVDLTVRNGITIMCQSEGGCNGSSPHPFTMEGTCGTKTNVTRISSWDFTGTAVDGHYFFWYCYDTDFPVRFDHLTFTNIGSTNIAMMFGDGSVDSEGRVYGVVDHVTCTGSSTYNFLCTKNASGGDSQAWAVGAQGSANNLFVEDSFITMANRPEFGSGGHDDTGSNSTVYRFNTVVGTVIREHSMCHGGPYSFEAYGNTVDTTGVDSPGFWDIHFQGSGEIQIWGNRVTSGSTPIAVQHYRSDDSQLPQGDCEAGEYANGTRAGAGTAADPLDGNRSPIGTYRGYPAWHQPGRDGNATLKPIYDFENRYTVGGSLVNIAIESGTWTGLQANCADTDSGRINCHFQKNRDIYQQTGSFTGASGMGVGTLASRPSTCTPTPEALDSGNGGVGYWATDQGSWNQSSSNPRGVNVSGADGVLYRCSATDTWTVAYTPYTYPHPYQSM